MKRGHEDVDEDAAAAFIFIAGAHLRNLNEVRHHRNCWSRPFFKMREEHGKFRGQGRQPERAVAIRESIKDGTVSWQMQYIYRNVRRDL